MLRLSRSPWRDGHWVVPGQPGPVRFRSLSLSERIRAIPAHSTDIQLQFVSWWLFLVLYFVARILIALYMTCFVFSVTKGIPLPLSPAIITSSSIAAFQSGSPIEDKHGAVVLDPGRDCLHLLEIQSDGSILFQGEAITATDLGGRLSSLHDTGTGLNEYLAVRVAANASYQDFVNVVDSVSDHNESGPRPAIGVFLLGRDGL